jgi:predicted adenylyl cyclase CyaB
MINEIEIKFKIEENDNIRNKLLELGGVPQNPYEQTTYGFFSYDSIEKGIFPRIRDEHGKIILTVKVRPKKKTDYFERKEYSMEILNVDDGVEIMKSIGYDQVRIFKKNREEWKFDKVEVVLDKLYFGTYIEIEGPKEEIEKMVKKLDFEKKERITKAYLGLEDDYLKEKNK